LFGKTLLKAQNDYVIQKFGGHGPFDPSLATPMIDPVTILVSHQAVLSHFTKKLRPWAYVQV